jgi:Mg-chelatase subunit ChlD
VFVLDISGSVQHEYQKAMSFAASIVYGLDVDSGAVRVGAVAYSTSTVGQFYLSDYTNSRESVVNALRFYNIGGTTDTADALDSVLNIQLTSSHGARPGVQKVVIVVSDGYSNVNPTQTIPKASALRANGVLIYSVANGDSPQLSELSAIASSPDSDYVLQLTGSDNIDATANTLLDRLCAA